MAVNGIRIKKYWSFPDTDGTLEKILDAFKGEEIHLDPALQAEISSTKIHIPVIAKDEVLKQSQIEHPSPILFSEYNFEDLRRELVSRKYSYKTVKGYVYYNRDFWGFVVKSPSRLLTRT